MVQELNTEDIKLSIDDQEEVIDLDEALKRAGGFGIYQVLLYFSVATLNVYGEQITQNFIYLTNTHKELCNGRPCTREEICFKEFQTVPDTENRDYIFALTAQNPQMHCWTTSQTAFMMQLWFIGFFLKIILAPLLEKYGHLSILKRLILPLNLICFSLMYLPNSYFLRCLGFFFSGISRLKTIPFLLMLKEFSEQRFSAFAVTFYYTFTLSTITVFCLYIKYVSHDAVLYLHIINGISIASAILFYTIAVESPLRLISSGNQEKAIRNLNIISKINSRFGQHYVFDQNIKILATQNDVLVYQMQQKMRRIAIMKKIHMLEDHMESTTTASTAKSSLKISVSKPSNTTNISPSPKIQLLKLPIFWLFVFTKSYIVSMWFGNIFLIQKSVATGCIFDNGMILGTVDLLSFIACGVFSKKFDRYNGQCLQIIISMVVLVGQWFYPTNILSFILQCSLEFQSNNDTQNHIQAIPTNLQFLSMEVAAAIGALVCQATPSVIMGPYAQIFQIVFATLAIPVFFGQRYLHKKKKTEIKESDIFDL